VKNNSKAIKGFTVIRLLAVIGRLAAVGVALAMMTVSLLFVLMTIRSTAQTISGAEARRAILEHKDACFEVYHDTDGSKELWITTSAWHHPTFITSADEPTLALLAENNISWKTYVQGRDFGCRGPSRWLSLSFSFILTTGAVIILWRVARKIRPPPQLAASGV
jgi:hypothetical protein